MNHHASSIADIPPLAALIEQARLATLERYRRLAPADIAVLSQISHEAACTLGATQATVTFVDSEQIWFGGAFGFDEDHAPRENSFCDAVVRSAAPLLVPDALADARFRGHGHVRSAPNLRSYAGVPLIDGGGYTLGTVAVYSITPGSFPTSVLGGLDALSTLVRDFLSDMVDRPRVAGPPSPDVQGWLGVRAIAEPGQAGLIVVSVARRSPAEQAGLRIADVVHSIGGRVLSQVSDIAVAMADRPARSRVLVEFRRGGEWQKCQVDIVPRRQRVRAR